MLSHALLTLYRALSRHRLYAVLNVLGLAAGMAVFLVLTLVVRYERGFDRWIPHAADIYRVDTTILDAGRAPQEISATTFAAFDLLLADYPQIRAGTRLLQRDAPVAVDQTIDSEAISYVDADFLDVIALPVASGDAAHALSSPASVVVTESIARKYFGNLQALGRTLQISQNGIPRAYTVSAVLRDLPPDSTLRVKILAVITPAIRQTNATFESWASSSGEIYLRFADHADAAAVAAELQRFVVRRASGTGPGKQGMHPERSIRLSLVALPDTHFHDISVDAKVPGVDPRIVLSLGVVGLLALVTAAINYVNLATARAGLRAREVALRKVLGATRRMLLLHFLGEAAALAAISGLIGLALAEIAIPMVNSLGGWAVRIDYLQVVPLVLVVVLLVGLGAGGYPAVLLASYRPAAVLSASRMPAGGRTGARLRNLLVLVQFASAIAFGICTLVIDAQASFLRDADRGFDRHGLIVVESLAARQLVSRETVILDALRGVPGVTSATLSDREPNSSTDHDTGVSRPGQVGPAPDLIAETVGGDYFRTYGVRLLAGRVFDDAHGTDDLGDGPRSGRTVGTILNRQALATLGFTDPAAALGHALTVRSRDSTLTLQVIGVVQDVRFMSPRAPVAPQYYTYDTHGFDFADAAIRFDRVPRQEIMRRLQAAWRSVVPEVPFVAETADERLADFYQPDQQRARLFSAGATLAIAIACVGLYGLASFNTARRVKEIGIRKVLGASTRDVLLLLIGQFIRPVLLANLIAWPIAWLAMRDWLTGFDQRIDLSPGYFAAATLVAVGVSISTVLGHAWRVARAEPAWALRYE